MPPEPRRTARIVKDRSVAVIIFNVDASVADVRRSLGWDGNKMRKRFIKSLHDIERWLNSSRMGCVFAPVELGTFLFKFDAHGDVIVEPGSMGPRVGREFLDDVACRDVRRSEAVDLPLHSRGSVAGADLAATEGRNAPRLSAASRSGFGSPAATAPGGYRTSGGYGAGRLRRLNHVGQQRAGRAASRVALQGGHARQKKQRPGAAGAFEISASGITGVDFRLGAVL